MVENNVFMRCILYLHSCKMLSKDAAWYYKKEKNAWRRLFMSPVHNLVHIVALGSSTSFIDSSDPILFCVCVRVSYKAEG